MKPSPSLRHAPHPVRRSLLALVVVPALACATAVIPAGAAEAAPDATTTDPSVYVDPLVGTSNAGNTHPGAVTPFGMLTWGPDESFYNGPTSGSNTGRGTMRTPSPSGYEYGSNSIRGFSLTHVSGAGCTGLSGDIPFMPWSGDVEVSPSTADATGAAFRSTFSHSEESASPGRYSVLLDSGVGVDLAATTRTGSGHFTYPEERSATMLVRTSDSLVGSSDADITIDAASRTISGSVTSGNFCGPFTGDGILQRSYYTLHFVAEFDTDFASVGTWTDGQLKAGSTEASGGTGYTGGLGTNGSAANGYPPAGKGSGGWVTFAGHDVNVRVGISYVSEDNARANLTAENPRGTTVDTIAASARAAWNRELGRVDIGGGTSDERVTFYTALYHSMLHPNVTSDSNGEYTGFDLATHTVSQGQAAQYATFSGWDVYRSQVQLVTLLDPERGSDIAESLLNQADQNGGVWDRWTHNSGAVHVMVGDPSAIAVAGIVAFGGDDFPVDRAFASLAKGARVPTALDLSRRGWNVAVEGQRPSLDRYLTSGYYPEGCNAWACANETLEMAGADYALATLAQHLGDEDSYQEFVTRSQSWQNQFNPDATAGGGYFQSRMQDGSWVSGFDPSSDAGFVEGTAAQYVWMVPHDVAGLFDAMGGNDRAVSRLDGFFRDAQGNWVLTGSWNNNSHANMDNEPSVATPWLYNYAGAPWKTQQTVRETIKRLWLKSKDGIPNGPDGIPGNDDLGAMSSWLVLASMGIYPQNPSRAELTLATPLFPGVTIHRGNGATVTIKAPGATIDTAYIGGVRVDGEESTKTYLPAEAISRDTLVEITPTTQADTSWGTGEDDAPPSVREGEVTDSVSLSTTRLGVAPGGATPTVTVSARRIVSSATGEVSFSVDAPEGLKASSASGVLTEESEGHAGVGLTFRAGEDLAEGDYPVTVSLARGDVDLGTQTLTVTVSHQSTTLFSTGFETGEPRADTNQRLEASGFGDFCCGIGGVESKVQGGETRNGSQAIVYSARALAQDARASNVLLDVDDVVVPANATFSYSVRPQRDGGPFGDYVQDASQFVAVDLLYTDGTRLSSSGVVASNGATLDPREQALVLEADAWNDISVAVPAADVGKSVDKVLLSFSTGSTFASEGRNNGYLRGWVDDLSLVAAVAPIGITPVPDLSVEVGSEYAGPLVSFVGGAGVDDRDYSATVDWGDGSAVEAGQVSSAAAGEFGDPSRLIEGTHTYTQAGSHVVTVVVTDADGVNRTGSVPVLVTEKAVVYSPVISAEPGELEAGTALRVTGSGFAPGETVLIDVSTSPALSVSAVADGEGQLDATVTVPSTTEPGSYDISATGNVSAVPALARVSVLAPSGPVDPAPTAVVRVVPTTVAAGGSIRVEGEGFNAGERVGLTLSPGDLPLGTATATRAGTFTSVLVVDADTEPGRHVLSARGEDSGASATADLTVVTAASLPVPGPDGTPGATSGSGSLARTGVPGSLGLLTLTALLSACIGVSGVLLRRRGVDKES